MRKLLRLTLGTLLPVLLFSILLVMLEPNALPYFLVILVIGYVVMILPSLLYSFLINLLQKRGMPLAQICMVGAGLGALFSLTPVLWMDLEFRVFLLCVYGALIGAVIPLILHKLKDRSKQINASSLVEEGQTP